MEYVNGICSICDNDTKVRHYSIYAFGSEGIWACEKCGAMIARMVASLAATIKSRICWAKYKEKAKDRAEVT